MSRKILKTPDFLKVGYSNKIYLVMSYILRGGKQTQTRVKMLTAVLITMATSTLRCAAELTSRSPGGRGQRAAATAAPVGVAGEAC